MGTYTLASSRPRSLTGVPDLGETKLPSEISSRPTIRPGHHEPFLRRTQTKAPTDASMALVLMLLILQLGSAELLPISETPTQSFQTQKQTKNQREKSSKSIKSQYFEANPGARTSYKGRFHGEMLINPLKPVAQKKQTAKKNSAKRKNTQEDKTPNKPWIEGFYDRKGSGEGDLEGLSVLVFAVAVAVVQKPDSVLRFPLLDCNLAFVYYNNYCLDFV